MNKVGLLLEQLYDAETDLAADYRQAGERHAVEQDIFYLSHTLAEQCDEHARSLRRMGEKLAASMSSGDGSKLATVMSSMRQKMSELMGRRPEAGLLLLQDLRGLYLAAQEVNVLWIALGQVAQALRDQELLDEVSLLHKQTLTQIKWLKTRLRETAPQVLCTG